MKETLLAVLFLLASAAAQAQTPFYQGKTIRIVTGYPAGDVNDLWPRLVAQHMGKYIPGNPNFIVQNMPGASSMIAANHVFNIAKPDGLTLGWIAPTLYFDQLVAIKNQVQRMRIRLLFVHRTVAGQDRIAFEFERA